MFIISLFIYIIQKHQYESNGKKITFILYCEESCLCEINKFSRLCQGDEKISKKNDSQHIHSITGKDVVTLIILNNITSFHL